MKADTHQAYTAAGEIASRIRKEVTKYIKEDTCLLDIAEYVETRTEELGGTPAFPTNISINEVASHFTPQDKTLKLFKGDVVKIDFGVHINGYIADTATTIETGTNNHTKLIQTTKKALNNAIKIIQDGIDTKTIGETIHNTLKKEGYNTLTELTGHNLSQYTIHAGITIPNYPAAYTTTLHTDDVIAIEPFATYGNGNITKRPPTIHALKTNKTPKHHPLYEEIKKKYHTLPFTPRWLNKNNTKTLKSSNFIKSYPVLATKDKQITTHEEHTLIIEETDTTIITQ